MVNKKIEENFKMQQRESIRHTEKIQKVMLSMKDKFVSQNELQQAFVSTLKAPGQAYD